MQTKSGTRFYTEATVKIFFSDGDVCCAKCPLLQTYSRNQCTRTAEYIGDTRGIGAWCPLEINEEMKEVHNGIQNT